jgi:hypothetical protein
MDSRCTALLVFEYCLRNGEWFKYLQRNDAYMICLFYFALFHVVLYCSWRVQETVGVVGVLFCLTPAGKFIKL